MSAIRKIHNLLNSGAVTVTGPNQQRGTKARSSLSNNVGQTQKVPSCYVCAELITQYHNLIPLINGITQTNHIKFPNKISQVVGEAFVVVIGPEDVICSRCTNLLNYLDRLESDSERVRNNIRTLLGKTYQYDDPNTNESSPRSESTVVSTTPPAKMQKLSSGMSVRTSEEQADITRMRKLTSTVNDHGGGVEQQMKNTGNAQQQPQQQQHQPLLIQSTTDAGTLVTSQRKMAKIYKCLICEYKSSDMRLFNTHYESCKKQNFQCKNCRKIFANFGLMKQHMVSAHKTSMDNTCAVCHINFATDAALRKHMETLHSTNVFITTPVKAQQQLAQTSPKTAAVSPVHASANTTAVNATASTLETANSQLFSCSACQFRTSDKQVLDEHLRKHAGGKLKPFKCRLCSMRFETRDAATVHARQHQPNYFKCGTCSMSFSKRELLVKHFETHNAPTPQPQQQQHHLQQQVAVSAAVQQNAVTNTTHQLTTHQQVQQQSTQQQQQQQQQHHLHQPAKPVVAAAVQHSTQKLLHETIEEALSENVVHVATNVSEGSKDIRFFSCQVCSLTFLQETYYNQHMETHRAGDKKGANVGVTISEAKSAATTASNAVTTNNSFVVSTSINSTNTNILNTSNKADNEAAAAVANTAAATVTTSTTSADESNAGTNVNSNNLDSDIESIFEKMHADKGDGTQSTATAANGNNVHVTATSGASTSTTTTGVANSVAQGGDFQITSQESSSGGITFNISLAQADAAAAAASEADAKTSGSAAVAGSIDMPMLDQPEEGVQSDNAVEKTDNANAKTLNTETENDDNVDQSTALPTSMPSLDDDVEISEAANAAAVNDANATELPANGGDKSEDKTQSTTNAETNAINADGSSAEEAEGNEEGVLPEQQLAVLAAGSEQQLELDEAALQAAQAEGGQIKFLLNENGELLQLDGDAFSGDGHMIVNDPEQVQHLLQNAGLLPAGASIDGETLQVMTDANGQMVLVHGGDSSQGQLIDASLLCGADGQLMIHPNGDGELGEGAHVISEDGTRIPVSLSYTADGQPIVQVQQQVLESADGEAGTVVEGDAEGGAAAAGTGFFALEELMQQSEGGKSDD